MSKLPDTVGRRRRQAKGEDAEEAYGRIPCVSGRAVKSRTTVTVRWRAADQSVAQTYLRFFVS